MSLECPPDHKHWIAIDAMLTKWDTTPCCALDDHSLCRVQDDGTIEPGAFIDGEWFCQSCLDALRSGAWWQGLRDVGYCVEELMEHPGLMEYLTI